MMQEQNSSGQNYDVFLNSKRNAILPIHLVSIVIKQMCQGNLKIKTSACHTVGQYLIPWHNKWCQTHLFWSQAYILSWLVTSNNISDDMWFPFSNSRNFLFPIKKNFTLKTRGIWQYYSTDKKLYTHMMVGTVRQVLSLSSPLRMWWKLPPKCSTPLRSGMLHEKYSTTAHSTAMASSCTERWRPKKIYKSFFFYLF